MTVPEIYREVEAINQEREFRAAMAANIANYAMAEDQATLDKFLGRDRSKSKKHWAEKAFMYFDMSARSGEMEDDDADTPPER